MRDCYGGVNCIDYPDKVIAEVWPVGRVATELLTKSPGKSSKKILLLIFGLFLPLLGDIEFIILDPTRFLGTLHFIQEKLLVAFRNILVISQVLFC